MQRVLLDEGVVVNVANAVVAGDTAKANFYISRVKPHLANVLNAWVSKDPLHNANAPLHPGETEEYKKFLQDSYAEIKQLKQKGDAHFDTAQRANKISDNYVLMTVVFSVVMFLCGLAPKKASVKLSFVLNVVSAIICFGMLIVLFVVMPLAKE